MGQHLNNEVIEFVIAREYAREYGAANDPIIAEYRFCNVRREDDKVTRWLKKNWRDPYAGHPNMTVAMLLARMVNWPPTLANIGFPAKWDEDHIISKIHESASKGKAWSGAYIVSTCGQQMDKAQYVVGTVCGAALGARIQPALDDTLESFWTRLKGVNGLGAGFIAAQVVADLKYCDADLMVADDWWDWAVPGPGSRRGINRYFKLPLENVMSAYNWKAHLNDMISEVEPPLLEVLGERIHAQDWQNVMCEFDKYMRVKNGEGRPRARYTQSSAYSV